MTDENSASTPSPGSDPDDTATPSTQRPAGDSPEAPPPVQPDEETKEAGKKKKKKDKKKKKKKKGGGSARGIETMFRTSYRTHLDLSSLADNKANIMISINGIIISILLASIYPRITENHWLLFPTAVLLVGCLLSLVYAVLSARPRVTRGEATLEDVRKGRANILFFGTFAGMEEDDFVTGMRELIDNPEQAYGNMIRDIYGLGSVLETKYRLLRISYTLFMFGLIAGVVLFLVVFAAAAGSGTGF